MSPPLSAVPEPNEGSMDVELGSRENKATLSRGGSPSPLSARRLLSAERDRKALRLRCSGMSFEAIARELGYPDRRTAARGVARANDRANEQNRKEALAEADARYDYYRLMLSKRIEDGEPRAVEVALQIDAAWRSLHGYDAPKKVEVTDAVLEQELERERAELTIIRGQLPAGTDDIVDAEIVESAAAQTQD